MADIALVAIAVVILVGANAVISAFGIRCMWILWRSMTHIGSQVPDITFSQFLHFFWFSGWFWVVLLSALIGLVLLLPI